MGNIELNWIYGCISTEDTLVDKAQLQIKIYEFFQKEIAEPLGKELHFEAYGKELGEDMETYMMMNGLKQKNCYMTERLIN